MHIDSTFSAKSRTIAENKRKADKKHDNFLFSCRIFKTSKTNSKINSKRFQEISCQRFKNKRNFRPD